MGEPEEEALNVVQGPGARGQGYREHRVYQDLDRRCPAEARSREGVPALSGRENGGPCRRPIGRPQLAISRPATSSLRVGPACGRWPHDRKARCAAVACSSAVTATARCCWPQTRSSSAFSRMRSASEVKAATLRRAAQRGQREGIECSRGAISRDGRRGRTNLRLEPLPAQALKYRPWQDPVGAGLGAGRQEEGTLPLRQREDRDRPAA